jgi:hypothetical protein
MFLLLEPAFSEKHHLVADRFRRVLLAEPYNPPDHFSNRAAFLVPVEKTRVRLVGGYRQEIVIGGDEDTVLRRGKGQLFRIRCAAQSHVTGGGAIHAPQA